MDFTAEIADLRAEFETVMTDTCTVTRNGAPSGPPFTPDPVTGLVPTSAAVTVYSGPCSTKVPGSGARVRMHESAGDEVHLLFSVLSVPVSAARLLVGDLVTFTGSKFNPNLPGMVFRVTDLMPGSHPVTQRVAIEAVTG
jgi:hypothetical protein